MNKYLPILIFFILADVVGSNSILQMFGIQPPIKALTLSMGMLVLQMLAAPIQAGFSDFYCRKKSLIVALVFSLLSLIVLFFTKLQGSPSIIFFVLILLMNGAFGNIVPLSWAAIADTQEKNLRFSLALSTGAYAIGYMFLAILNMHAPYRVSIPSWLSLGNVLPISLFVLAIVFCVLFFLDVRDKKLRHPQQKRLKYLELAHSEAKSLLKDIGRDSTRWGLLAYFLWATSQYSVLVFLTDFQTRYTGTVIFMMCGYLTGVGILGLCKNIKDAKMLKIAFVINISSLSLFFVINPFVNGHILLSICYFFYTIGNAFLSPSILSLFAKDRKVGQQGKGFGLIVSADGGGFLVALMAVIIFHYLKLNLWHMVLFSFVTFLISWIPYSKYEKTRKDAAR